MLGFSFHCKGDAEEWDWYDNCPCKHGILDLKCFPLVLTQLSHQAIKIVGPPPDPGVDHVLHLSKDRTFQYSHFVLQQESTA